MVVFKPQLARINNINSPCSSSRNSSNPKIKEELTSCSSNNSRTIKCNNRTDMGTPATTAKEAASMQTTTTTKTNMMRMRSTMDLSEERHSHSST